METRTQRQTKRYNDFSGGNQEFTSPLWNQENEAKLAKNVNIRRPGILSKADGYTQLGSTGSNGAVRGLFSFDQEDGTHTLLKVHDTAIYKYDSGWSSIKTGLTSVTVPAYAVNAYMGDSVDANGAPVSPEERIYMAVGHDNVVQSWDGTNMGTVANMYAKHVEVFNNRLILGNVKETGTVYANRFWQSTVGAQVFDTAGDALAVDSAGGPITGLKTFGGLLYVFTDNELLTWDEFNVRRVPGDFGTTAGKTVQVVYGRLMWLNRQGVFIYGGSGLPEIMSRRIQGWIDAITDYTACSAGVDQYGRYELYIGDVTYDGTAYTDVVLVYDPLIDTWHVEPNKPFGTFGLLKSGGGLTAYAGDLDNDKVWTLGGTSNAGSAIGMEWRTPWLDSGRPENTKNFYKFYMTYKPTGNSEYLTVQYRLDGASSWNNVEGSANNIDLSGSDALEFAELDLPANTQGRFIQFRITHSSSNAGAEIYEYTVEYDEIG